jgi:hypothetical protein
LPQICAVLYDIENLRREIDGLDATMLAAVSAAPRSRSRPRACAAVRISWRCSAAEMIGLN